MSQHSFTRTIAGDGLYDLGAYQRPESVEKRVQAAIPSEPFTTSADADTFTFKFANALDSGQVTTLTDTVNQYIDDVANGLLPIPVVQVPFAGSEGESTDSTGSFQDKVALTFDIEPDGQAGMVIWNFELRVDDGDNRGVEARVLLDGAWVVGQQDHIGIVSSSLLGSPKGTVRGCAGIVPMGFTGGQHTVAIQFRRSGSAGVAAIRRARIIVRTLDG